MIEVGCYLCGSKDGLILFEQDFRDPYLDLVDPVLNSVERRWKACRDCGFVYRSPMLSEAEQEILYRNYGDDVFKKETPDAYFDRITGLPPSESENHAKALWLKSELSRYAALGPGKTADILDVGCGAGLLMNSLGKILPFPVRPHGVELNPDYAALAARRLNADIKRVDYRPGLFGKKFPLVMCTKVLEHVRDPVAFVKMLVADLSDDGALFLEVPDVADLANFPAEHERFYIAHIYFFSKNTLEEVLNRCGLGVTAARVITTPRGRGYLQMLAGRSKPGSLTSMPYDDAEGLLALRRRSFAN